MFEMPPRFPQNVVPLLPFHVAKAAIRIFRVAAGRAGIRINSLMIDGSRERVICNRRKGMISEESSFKIPSPKLRLCILRFYRTNGLPVNLPVKKFLLEQFGKNVLE